MLNFLTTFGAETQFEKNRLLLTKPNYEAPNEQALKNILHSFAGQDEQTRAQIAFACIIKKIHTSPGKQNWSYLLKNLIILDRVMSENRFCEQMAQTTLMTINNYTDKDPKAEAVNARGLLTGYWDLIQEMCRLKISRLHILYYKRSDRKSFLQGMGTFQIVKQIKILQKLFESTLSLIFLTSGISKNRQTNYRQTEIVTQKSRKYYQQFTNSSLADYLNINFYSKLLTFFSCQYLCIHKFIQVILYTTKTEEHRLVTVDDAKMFKKMVFKFKNNCQEMRLLVERNKTKKGFQNIDTKQFSTFSEEHIIKAVDQYINHQSLAKNQNLTTPLPIIIDSQRDHNPLQPNFVDRKPVIYQRYTGSAQKTPRKYIQFKRQNNEQQNAFINYFSSYSEEFPHKSMMTLDLIEDIRRDEQRNYEFVLDPSQGYGNPSRMLNFQESPNEGNHQNQDFFTKFEKLKQKTKFKDIIISTKDQQKYEDSTSYSNINSSRGGSLFDVLNIKWQTQKSEA